LKPNFASIPARSIIRAKAAEVNGAPRFILRTVSSEFSQGCAIAAAKIVAIQYRQ
jgi:hypothetical protein